MCDLVVLAFPNETGARQMEDLLISLQRQAVIQLEDAAYVVRRQNGKVKVKQAVNLVGQGALGGAFWGLLIGLLFWAPWLGLAIGAATGAVAGHLTDTGIDNEFIKEVTDAIEPGQSALFLLIAHWMEDGVLEHIEQFEATVIRTSLSEVDEAKLRAAFHHEEDA